MTAAAAPPGPARLTVDLRALAGNWERLRDLAAPAEVAAVVKADAYGLGADRVAPALARAGCRVFFVARAAEGVALRRALDRERRILVLDGLAADGAEACVEHGLVPVLNQPGEVERWRSEARRRGRRLPAALHLDTGMCRLGLADADARRLAQARPRGLDLVLVMSHLACAEERAHPLNALQLARFDDLSALFPGVPRSLANSSGLFLGAPFRFELGRPGVALYGVNPTPGAANPMRPVVRVEAPVLQVREVDAPGSVGYGATRATRPGQRIATLPVGYADGFPRAAGPDWSVRFGADELPLAGRVSMDLMSVDATGTGPGLRPGAMVELVGGPDGVDRLAEAAGTIGYEVLTRLGRRFERVYLDDEDGTDAA